MFLATPRAGDEIVPTCADADKVFAMNLKFNSASARPDELYKSIFQRFRHFFRSSLLGRN